MALLFSHLPIGAIFTDNRVEYRKVSQGYAESESGSRVTFNAYDAVFIS